MRQTASTWLTTMVSSMWLQWHCSNSAYSNNSDPKANVKYTNSWSLVGSITVHAPQCGVLIWHYVFMLVTTSCPGTSCGGTSTWQTRYWSGIEKLCGVSAQLFVCVCVCGCIQHTHTHTQSVYIAGDEVCVMVKLLCGSSSSPYTALKLHPQQTSN